MPCQCMFAYGQNALSIVVFFCRNVVNVFVVDRYNVCLLLLLANMFSIGCCLCWLSANNMLSRDEIAAS